MALYTSDPGLRTFLLQFRIMIDGQQHLREFNSENEVEGTLAHSRILAMQKELEEIRKERQKDNTDSQTGRDSMTALPADLHFEIASPLPANDLLHLSRVSHALHDIFFSKSSRPAWIICLSNVDAPRCPEDLIEPKYASLLFDTPCESCGILPMHADVTVYYESRVRFCRKCLYKNVMQGKDIANNFDAELAIIPDIYTLVPYLKEGTEKSSWYQDNSLPIILQDERFLVKNLTMALKEYREVKSNNPDYLPKYVEEMQQRREFIVKHCGLLQRWQRKHREKEMARKYSYEAARKNWLESFKTTDN